MAKLFFFPPLIFNGQPLEGGTITTYITDTTTPKTAYTDADEGTPLDNPLTLNQHGYQALWLATDSRYKIVVKDSSGSELFTLNEVEGMSSSLTGSPALTAILDSSGNEIVSFSGVASAVNYITFINSVTGSGAIIKSVGDDVNVDLRLQSQGSTSEIQAENPLVAEDSFKAEQDVYRTGIITPSQITANQNNYEPTGASTAYEFRISSDAARSITGIAGGASGREIQLTNVGSFAITLSNADANSTEANRFAFTGSLLMPASSSVLLKYDGTASRWRAVNSGLTAASQADMETATSTVTAVTPAVVCYAPCAAKGWVLFNGTGTPAITVSYPSSGYTITDNGTGNWTLNLPITFSSTNYVMVATGASGGTHTAILCKSTGTAATATAITLLNFCSVHGAAEDLSDVNVVLFGDL